MKETILSVGIDIGTSTTQLVFSEIRIENMASMVSIPRLKIMDKQVVHESEIYTTPLVSAREIDGRGVREIVEKEYARAGIKPDQVGTGAVIITGETARKSNAAQVLSTLSGLAGEFVVATAGPSLEGIIAGKGANAHAESKDRGA
ncbi:MAG: ethanolamine ammonia-lyase reactivating factor EutA, partial [Desulfobacterales bacterium]|nr:ethanolamine ammonia-lyase reactivating factor EutA [Desulfobacterales bacterium]